MRFLDFEAKQVDEQFKSLTLTHAGFLVGLGGGAASLLDSTSAPCSPFIALCMVPFVVGLLYVVRARNALRERLRDAAQKILTRSPKRDLGCLEASEVWAGAISESFKSADLLKSRCLVMIGAGIMFVVVGEVAFGCG